MILLYHKIARLQHDYNFIAVTPKNFRYQMGYLKEQYDIVPLDYASDDTLSITFDDGFRDFYTEAYPYLSENNIPAAIFITTGRIGSKEELWTSELLRTIFTGNDHKAYFHLKMPLFTYDFPTQSLDDKMTMYQAIRRLCMKSEEAVLKSILSQLREWAKMESAGREEYFFLSEQEIKILAEDSLVTIGAHTCNHISLGAFEEAYQEKEIVQSKMELEEITGKQIQYFSYPFGRQYDYSKETIDILKRLGFQKAYTTLPLTGKDLMYEIPRITVPNFGEGEFESWFQQVMQKQQDTCGLQRKQSEAVEYIGKLKSDKKLLQGSKKIAVFGAGVRGERVYRELTAYGKGNEVICFVDNDKIKQGSYIEGKPVISVGQIQEAKPEIIIVNSVWEKEIIEQMIRRGVRGIHWIVN